MTLKRTSKNCHFCRVFCALLGGRDRMARLPQAHTNRSDYTGARTASHYDTDKSAAVRRLAKNRHGVVMVRRPFVALAILAPMLGVLAEPAASQATTAAASSTLGPAPSSAPDPLTPPEILKPPPTAPGVPTLPADAAKAPSELDPIVALVRQRLPAAVPPNRSAGDREDHAGLVAFYAEHAGAAVWTAKSGFTVKAVQAMAEIRKADDWGLKASAFELPLLPEAPTPEMLAEAEIKLGLAALKYGRHARGGRVDPPSIHRIFDQKPTIYEPKTLMLALAATP